MNYIKETNAFYDWLETNPLSHSAINLWHALMHINNKTGWITEFTVAISTLENKTGLKKDAITGARHRLQQVKRIDFRSRSGQQSAVYTIIPFESFKTTQISNSDISVVLNDTNDTTSHSQIATQPTTQSTSIIKLNETILIPSSATTKIDNNIPGSSTASFYEPTDEDKLSVSDIHTKVFGTLFMTPYMTEFVKKYCNLRSEYFVKEVMIEAGKSANKPSIKYMESTADRWIAEGINSRKESEERRTADTELNNLSQPGFIYKFFREKIGDVSYDVKNIIDRWIENYSQEWTKNAIELAYKKNRRDSLEISTILKMWKKSGLSEPWKSETVGEYRAGYF